VAFVPNAPNPEAGQVVLAEANTWKSVDMDSWEMGEILKKMGKGL
jgi:uncharacterized membrane protein